MILQITPKEVKARLDAGEDIKIIDIREDWELAQMSLDIAEHIPMYDVPDSLDRIPMDKPVVIMCNSGNRSEQVVVWMQAEGYDNLYNLVGGIQGWMREVK